MNTLTLTPQAVNSKVEVTGDDPTAVRDIKQLSFNHTDITSQPSV